MLMRWDALLAERRLWAPARVKTADFIAAGEGRKSSFLAKMTEKQAGVRDDDGGDEVEREDSWSSPSIFFFLCLYVFVLNRFCPM